MELRQLEYFVAVAEEANFTRAAARVHISQSGVSAQIRQLERELGQLLLDRTSRSVRLTEVGAAVLPHARRALDAAGEVRLVVDELSGLLRGQARVGMVSGCALTLVPDLLAEFHDRFPGVAIGLVEGASDRLSDGLRRGDLDLALIGSAGLPPAGLETAVVADEALVAVVAAEHPLASRKTVTIEGLREHQLISLPVGTGIRAALDGACAAAGFTPRIAFEAGALPMVVQLASRGLGVALVPGSSVTAEGADRRVLAVVRPTVRSRLELAWRPDAASPAARALVEHARGFVVRLAAGQAPAA